MRVKMKLPDGRKMEYGREYVLVLFAGLGDYRFRWTRGRMVILEEIGPFGLGGERTRITKKQLKLLTSKKEELLMWMVPLEETII